MPDIEQSLRMAWSRIRILLLRDADELHRRLARRRLALMQRPPRAWCIALRASDRRIDDTTAIIHRINSPPPESSSSSPCRPLAPSPPHPHHQRVTISYQDLRLLTWPISLAAPGEPADEVAKKLGTTPSGLITARLKNRFHTHHKKGLAGRRGKPVPILYSPDDLDPTSRDFAAADPLWGWTAKYLADRLDEKSFIPQPLTRIPVHRPISDIYRRLRAQSSEQAEREPRRPSRKLPPPEPDHVWYKWSKDNHYLGDDHRFWRKTPNDPGDWPSAQRHAELVALKKTLQKNPRRDAQTGTRSAGGALRYTASVPPMAEHISLPRLRLALPRLPPNLPHALLSGPSPATRPLFNPARRINRLAQTRAPHRRR